MTDNIFVNHTERSRQRSSILERLYRLLNDEKSYQKFQMSLEQ